MRTTVDDYTVILRPVITEMGAGIHAEAFIPGDDGLKHNRRVFTDYTVKTQRAMLRRVTYYLKYRDPGK